MSEYITKKEKKSEYITKKEKKPQYITKKEKKPQYITKKDSAQTSGKETVSDAQKRGKIDLGSFMAKGGRVGLKSGSKGCKLAMKGKGRAYGKNS